MAAMTEGMARPTADTVQVTFRIPTSWLEEADEIAKTIARPGGMTASRTDAFREAIRIGFDRLRPKGKPTKAKR